MLFDRIQKEHTRIQKQIKSIQKQLDRLPPGKLICAKNGKYFKWYESDGHTKTTIHKTNRAHAEVLAKKKYLGLLLEDLQSENRAIEFYLRHHHPESGKAENLLTNSPGYRELLSPYFQTKSKSISAWLNEPYQTNTSHPEHLKHKSVIGSYVRSKSESLILSALHHHHIPFRYECMLELGYQSLCPDFTLLHPKTLEIYYWEHFGMIDDPEYAKKACQKIMTYTANGIYPSVNLILTWETDEQPLNAEMIEKIIEYYFL